MVDKDYQHIAIIGGGIAGLAAASLLASRGMQIILFEASSQLGGRARGLDYKGVKLDNGQHILLGAYKETLALLKLAGVDEGQVLMRLPLNLTMLDVNSNNTFALKACNVLPAPLHILAGLLLAKGLTFSSRLSAIKLMIWMKLNAFKLNIDVPLYDFLQAKKQPEAVIKNLWEPLCLAALNTPIQFASTQIFLNVLRDSFARKKQDSDLLLPRVDLSTLMAAPLAAYIVGNGGQIKTNCAIKTLQHTADKITLHSHAGEHNFSHVIIACAPHQLSKLIIPSLVDYFTYQPITTVYLQYAKSVNLPQVMTGLVGSLSQWVFDKEKLSDQIGLIAVIISAHAPFDIRQEALAMRVVAELNSAFPQLKNSNLLWHKVITEKRATFSCNANLARPKAMTILNNVYLVGDFTANGHVQNDYPATIEGAVRSAIYAANLVQ